MNEEDSYYSEALEGDMCEICFADCHVFVGGKIYHHDSEEIMETEDDGWMLRDEVVYVEYRKEYHPADNCAYNNYLEEYHLNSDIG